MDSLRDSSYRQRIVLKDAFRKRKLLAFLP